MKFSRVPGALSLLFASSLLAQGLVNPDEAVRNWTAPPYWTPSAARDVGVEPTPQDAGEPGLRPFGGAPTPLPFSPIPPCRIVDTRGASGPFGGPALVANATRTFNLPSGPCAGTPGNAVAYSLNFTVIGGSGVFTNAFLTAWATGDTQPVVSTLNFNANQLEANAAVVPAGTSGSINVFVNAPGHLLIDINGYYTPIGIVNFLNGMWGSVALAAGAGISITPSSQTLTIANTAPAAWVLTGNAATTPGTNFLGTTDNQALELKVNNARAFRIEPTTGTPNIIGGFNLNGVTAGVVGATIAGGGLLNGNGNVVTDDYGFVGGGFTNRAGDLGGTTSDREAATVGGGFSNLANGALSFIGGGQGNTTNEVYGAIGGGASNVTSGYAATVPGGYLNTALADYSFAAGVRAKANHAGAFVWGDNTAADVASTGVNQFIVRASGGMWLGTTSAPSITIASDFLNTSTGAHLTIGGAWTNSSDFDRKQDFEPIDNHDVLARVASLPISRWSYKAESCSVRHIGPTGQDFAAAFGLGSDDKSIATVDADGVALASIQALYEIVTEKDRQIAALEERLSRLEALVK
jgi:endosialidase-like protein